MTTIKVHKTNIREMTSWQIIVHLVRRHQVFLLLLTNVITLTVLLVKG